MRTVGYARVSGKSQIDGDGFPRQEEAIQKFCLANNLALDCILKEKGVSGTVECFDRPVFFEILTTLISGDCVVVERADRLARELMAGEMLLMECRTRGIRVYSADRGLVDIASDGADPTVVLIRQVLFAVAQFEKTALVLKLRTARVRIRAKTGRCEGRKPFGKTAAEQAALDFAMTAFSASQEYEYIAGMLNHYGHKPRCGEKFTRQSIRSILLTHKKNLCAQPTITT